MRIKKIEPTHDMTNHIFIMLKKQMRIVFSLYFYFSLIVHSPFRGNNACHSHYGFCRPKETCQCCHIIHTEVGHATAPLFITEGTPCRTGVAVLSMSTGNAAKFSFLQSFAHKCKLRTVYNCRSAPKTQIFTPRQIE